MSKKQLGIVGAFIAAIIVILGIFIAMYVNDSTSSNKNQSDEETKKSDLEAPEFNRVSVQDPSMIKVDDFYYIFGTNIEFTKSEDLMSWSSVENNETASDRPLYDDVLENLAQSFDWGKQNDGSFSIRAPEVIWNDFYVNPDGSTGAYLLYYSVTSTSTQSAIGFATSKEIEGPYQPVDTLIYSGFDDHEPNDNKDWENTHLPELIDQGKITDQNKAWFDYDGNYNDRDYPNAVDANVFFDSDDRLWMAYGSWSGGIFLLELDAETGAVIFPGEDASAGDEHLIDRYFGIKIAGGYWKSGEGAHVHYNEDNGYYYLYLTYGRKEVDGGYHVRQFRSESPKGPYLDANDQPAILPGDTNNASFGNKLFGNFIFRREVGEPSNELGSGYLSPGYSSIQIDPDTNQEYLVFQSKFPERDEADELRVHQMFLNQFDWPVVAPNEYTGEKLTDKLSTSDLVGYYKYINHGKDNSPKINESQIIELREDGSITGTVKGTWALDGYYATLTIDEIVYAGVFVETSDEGTEETMMSFTALSDYGVSVWGIQSFSSTLTAEEIVADVKTDLSIENPANITADLNLSNSAYSGTSIHWTSSDESIISSDGQVTRPVGVDGVLTLTATITNQEVSDTKVFEVTVPGTRAVNVTAHYAFEGDLSDSVGTFADGEPTAGQLNQPGGEITFTDGMVGQAAEFNGESGIRLPDQLIDHDDYSIALWIYPHAFTEHTPALFAALNEDQWISIVPSSHLGGPMVWYGNDEWYDALLNHPIRRNQWTHLAVTVESREIKIYHNGVLSFEGSRFPERLGGNYGYFALGVNYWDPPFQGLIDELVIYDGAIPQSTVTELYEQ